jgi:hypothetical protein
MHQEMSDIFANDRATWLSGNYDISVVNLFQTISQSTNLGGFPTPFGSFKGN